VARDVEALLKSAREELYHARVLTRQLRNSTKTLAAAYFDSEQRVEALIAEIESVLPTPRRPREHEHSQAHLSQTH
jgi:hypothetical protein